MDSATSTPSPVASFRTPPRILIPKLLKSRDGWKARAAARKKASKALKIKARDLTLSRDTWKERALAAEQKQRDLQDQLDHTCQLLDAATAKAEVIQKKMSPT
jgi:hypothetical protein